MKTGMNQPELKLSEVLASIGHNGKRITDEKQIYLNKQYFKSDSTLHYLALYLPMLIMYCILVP